MIPSANSTENQAGNLCWHSAETWQDQGVIPTVGSGLEARYFHSSRQPDWDWENAMILAQQTANGCEGNEEREYKSGVMQAEAIGGVSSLRQYEGLLSATVNPSTLSLSPNTWGLLSTVGVRDASSSGFQGSSNPSCSSLGATWIDGYAGGNGSSFYGDSRSSLLGLVNLDQRSRLEDIVKRELCFTGDFNQRIGLNLGGRTYFSADDNAFGRFGKRPSLNSPGPQAPLCQGEGCKADLRIAKHYHRRHKVCEYHSKAATVLIRGQTQRFCQQCSRFHSLSEFDDGKRSCRKRLADHNRRRRKPQHSPSAISSTTDRTIAQKKNESEEAAASESNRNGSLSKGSPTSSEDGHAVPRATSALALSREHSRQVSTLPERNDQKAINQNPLPGNCSAGPSLSLTSSGRVSHGVNGQKPLAGETYEGLDLTVKWLRSGNSGMKLVESDVTKSDCSPNAYMEKPRRDGSTLIQNVTSLQTSQDPNEGTDWIMKSIAQRGSKQLEAFSSTNLGRDGKSDGQNVLRLLERDNERDGQSTNKYSEETVHPTLRFLEGRFNPPRA